MINLEEIKSFFKGKILINEPLSNHTSFRIGGPADFYFEPIDKDDIIKLVTYLCKINFPYCIFGNGSNLLVSDNGLRCAVISLENSLKNKRIENDLVIAEAGIKLSALVDFCIQNGKAGIEMLAGIPGSLGGALIMNASAYGGSISDHIVDVEVFQDGELKRLKKNEINFSYRNSSLANSVILEASFLFPEGDINKIASIRKELLDKRRENQPVNYPSAGCIFKNPEGYHAALLIQEAGLKGLKIGGAEISQLHGNFIINTNNASANDVIELIKIVKKKIKETKGIDLQVEVKLIGFKSNPLEND
ncbi:MAG TPA: UDP-N-acetylmuramate dehydrogenase [Bacteroidota bacterium]|jgi:UDP-N-acetylmuramate dehydrogenase|nr:UDP-N-acetylmuramate dehydrogenase [Bacteroidota bacterium]